MLTLTYEHICTNTTENMHLKKACIHQKAAGLHYPGWLKKYPTRQNALSRQPIEVFSPKVEDLLRIDFAVNAENLAEKF